jgi:CubicO group peptidase (beta-lactamase class C family)
VAAGDPRTVSTRSFTGHCWESLGGAPTVRSLGALFRDEFARPSDLDVHIGLTSADERRVVPLADPDRLWPAALLDGHDECYRLALDNPPALAHRDVVNSSAWRRAEVPAVNAHGTARGVAKFYAGLFGGGQLDGVRVLSAQTVAAMTSPQTTGRDRLLGQHTTWGLGVGLENAGWEMGGIGGSLGWAVPSDGLAWAYATTRIGDYDRALAFEARYWPRSTPRPDRSRTDAT